MTFSAFLEIVLEAFFEDCLLLFPILFITFFVIEYLEHLAGDKLVNTIQRSKKTGPLWGALIGCVPQCSFSVSCAHLYNAGIVTAGTLAAVFLSTSDEAIPVLLSHPGSLLLILKLLGIKILIGLAAGFLLDFLYKRDRQRADFMNRHIEHECDAEDYSVKALLKECLKRTVSVWLVLCAVTIVLSFLLEFVSEGSIRAFLLQGALQPVLAGLFGFVPNCAVSVVLIELYLKQLISFGSLVAGLCSSAGLGIFILFKGKRGFRHYLKLLGYVYVVSVLAGELLQLLGVA